MANTRFDIPRTGEVPPRPAGAAPLVPVAPAPRARHFRADQYLKEQQAPALPGWAALAVLAGGCAAAGWAAAAGGHLPGPITELLSGAVPLDAPSWCVTATLWAAVLLVATVLSGLTVVGTGTVRVLSRFDRYRGTVHRPGLVWTRPFARRRGVDIRLRHWRSRPMRAADRQGNPLQVMVLVVWQVRDAARAAFAVRDHEQYLKAEIESVVGAVAAARPCDAFGRDEPSLRDTTALGEELTRRLAAAMAPVGVEIFSVQPLHVDYAPEVGETMLRRRVAALDAATRTTVLDDVVDTVTQAVDHLSRRDLVRLDDATRTEFVRDLTVAMYTARPAAPPAKRDTGA